MALGVLQEGSLPLLEHPPGEERGHEHFFGAAEAAHVDEDDLALEQLVEDPPSDGDRGVGGNAGQVHDAPRPAVHHLEGVEGHSGRQFDVPETGEVLDPGELGQPRQA